MQYTVKTVEDGRIQLEIGNLGVTFRRDSDIDTVIGGINILVEKILGVSPFQLTLAVIGELEKTSAAEKDDIAQYTRETAGAAEVQRETGSHQEEGEPEQGSSSNGEEGSRTEG